MSDAIKLTEKLAQVREKRRTYEQRRIKISRSIGELEEKEKILVYALEMIGAEVPRMDEGDLAGVAARRRKRGMRAIDVALQVVEIGEEITPQEAVARAKEREIEWRSANPANAISTAMGRSEFFVMARRGVYKRVDPTTDDGGLKCGVCGSQNLDEVLGPSEEVVLLTCRNCHHRFTRPA